MMADEYEDAHTLMFPWTHYRDLGDNHAVFKGRVEHREDLVIIHPRDERDMTRNLYFMPACNTIKMYTATYHCPWVIDFDDNSRVVKTSLTSEEIGRINWDELRDVLNISSGRHTPTLAMSFGSLASLGDRFQESTKMYWNWDYAIRTKGLLYRENVKKYHTLLMAFHTKSMAKNPKCSLGMLDVHLLKQICLFLWPDYKS